MNPRPIVSTLVLASLALLAGDAAGDEAKPFSVGVPIATITSGDITEASGLAASRTHTEVLWVHNDSGERPRLFTIGLDGKLIATFNLSGAEAHDWEDMALGPGPEPDAHYLYIGDIGDNFATRPSITVYRVREPDTAQARDEVELGPAVALEMRYPDGAHDAEALMCDPVSGDLFVITKDVGGANSVYRAAAPHPLRQPTVLEKVATVHFGGESASERATTGADISRDGGLIIVRSYNKARLWKRNPEQSVAEALAARGRAVPVPGPPAEPQGESVAFSDDGRSYFTLGEGLAQPLFRFERKLEQ